MPKFNDSKFEATLKANAATVLNVPEAAVPLDWMSLLLELITGIFSGCFNNPTPTPQTSAEIAAQLKSASSPQKAVMKRRTRKHYMQAGKTRKDGDAAHATMVLSVEQTPQSDLAQAIEDAREDANAVPEFDMI